MSVAGHEAAARREERTGVEHEQRFDPGAHTVTDRCQIVAPPGTPIDAGAACWTSSYNPTEQHLAEARRHRGAAADHRAASAALRDAETQACTGIPDEDRDMSPFAHREDIENVHPIEHGVTITLRAVSGMTAAWLQRLVDCHLARNAALGHNVPEMPYCPLIPKGAAAKVKSLQRGFAVEIRAEDDRQAATEIRRRAQALLGR